MSHMLQANIAELLRIPDFQKERQYYIEQGFKHYANGLWEEALDNLLKAEERERTDYVVLHRIGMIYLYRPELLDVPNARDHFERAGKYAAVESGEGAVRLANILGGPVEGGRLRENVMPADVPRRLAAETYLQAGRAAYVMGAFGDAAALSEKALSLNPDLLDAGFNQAKALVAAGSGTAAVTVLEPVIRRDRTYALKTTQDGDLALDADVRRLLEKLREEAVNRARRELETLQTGFQKLVSPPEDTEEELIRREKAIAEEFQSIRLLIERDTYLEALAALDQIVSGAEERAEKFSDLGTFRRARREAIDRANSEWESFRQEDFRRWHYQNPKDEENTARDAEELDIAVGNIQTIAEGKKLCHQISVLRGHIFAAVFRCRYALRGHHDRVEALSYSPDGRMLASGSGDKMVKIWDVASKKLLHTLSGHDSTVRVVSYSPDGQTLASGDDAGTVKIWDVASGEVLHTLSGDTLGVQALSYSPNGQTLASGSRRDDTLKIWDVTSGRILYSLEARGDVVSYSPDGWTLALESGNGTIEIWGARTKEEMKEEQREERERKQQEEEKRKRREEEQRHLEEKRCWVCGQPLSFLDKLAGRTTCKRHRDRNH